MRPVRTTLAVCAAAPWLAAGAALARSVEASGHSTLSTLQMVRSQVELHDVQNPQAPFDPHLGWKQLIDNGYLLDAPRCPVAGHRSGLSVGALPDSSAGWAWAADPSRQVSTPTVYARNESGLVLYNDADVLGSVTSWTDPRRGGAPPAFLLFAWTTVAAIVVTPIVLAVRGKRSAAGLHS
jgi:hypothetical protein